MAGLRGGRGYDHLPGEKDALAITSWHSNESVVLSSPVGDDGVPVATSFFISNFHITLCPSRGPESVISIPLPFVESWELCRVTVTGAQMVAFHPPPQAVEETGVDEQGQPTRDCLNASESKTKQASEMPTSPTPPTASSNGSSGGGSWEAAIKAVFPPPSLLGMDTPIGALSSSSGFQLRITTRHLWAYELLFVSDRMADTIREALTCFLSIKTITQMPAFELYQSRQCQQQQQQQRHLPGEPHVELEGGGTSSPKQVEDVVEFGWNIYDCEQELVRQLCRDSQKPIPDPADELASGIEKDLRPWFRTTSVCQPMNAYGKTPTYPFFIVAPNAASDSMLEEVIASRSRGRIPAISFVHLGTGAVLARCSQPLMKSSALRVDGDLCYMLVNSGYYATNAEPKRARNVPATSSSPNPSNAHNLPPPSLFDVSENDAFSGPASPRTENSPAAASTISQLRRPRHLLVADCRPSAAAYANRSMGGGYESGVSHDFCKVKFHGIDNIHAVTKSFNKMRTLLTAYNGSSPKENFLVQVHETYWLYHIQRVMMCCVEVADSLERGDSCLVHCTDGWDRTSQCTALVMLMLDPFYRTIFGFCLLVEKEFCSFGHKFAERCNQKVPGETFYSIDSGVSGSDTETSAEKLQPSPIFTQWMDVVYQVVRQFPDHFEFTPALLEYLSVMVYSGLYGTFLTNSERERMFEGVRRRTPSLWTDILTQARSEREGLVPLRFVNSQYDAHKAWEYISKTKNCGIQRLLVSCNSKRIVFWEDFYLKYDSDRYAIDLPVSSHQTRDGEAVKPCPLPCKELSDYLEKRVQLAVDARQREAAAMDDLLQRLMVQRMPPPQAMLLSSDSLRQGGGASPSGAGAIASLATVVKHDGKTCWQCHRKFTFFSTKEPCSRCGGVLCSDCIVRRGRLKYCRKCLAQAEMQKQQF